MQSTFRVRIIHRPELDVSMRIFMAKMPYNKEETGNKVECASIPYTAALVMLKMFHFIFVAGGPLDSQFRGLRIESSSILPVVKSQKRVRDDDDDNDDSAGDATASAKRIKPDPDAAFVPPVAVKPDPDAAAATPDVKHLPFLAELDARLALFELDGETAAEVTQKAECFYIPGSLEAETYERAKDNVVTAVKERVREEALRMYTFHMDQWHNYDNLAC